ncbi:expression site-associated gene (ESAG) protein, putative [Trypanosoma brucei brucei TREU927]|uniref:Expression site-associated gene (ESAG) protein, putative n=1 Tax=Trypanosoma brucei brucei (strain 927/4 GUTat10.1) TaxID=185431 RepID=Q387A2_TRYB2|nr:expression site-associated gene (ESAG) protein, putative [Trypanosoma brucei brucei TREU927]EAN79129.1 expression site-associated gene (ESAG) protein, putative [Trypanosoma brucei brucei TREU927]
MLKGARAIYGGTRGRLYAAMVGVMLLTVLWFLGEMSVRNKETGTLLRKKDSGRNYTPRVYYAVVHTRYSPGWCRMIVSSILTNASVATLGMGGWYGHVKRWDWIYSYMVREKMRESDVIMLFDGGDTYFTDAGVREEAVKHFLDTTPKIPEAFNETAILRGEMTPPMLFTAEKGCATPQLNIMVKPEGRSEFQNCKKLFDDAMDATRGVGVENILRVNESGRSYLNGGGVIARVWALKEALKVFFNLRRQSLIWLCDQTMWTIVLTWSVSRPKHVKPKLLLRRGIISLDYETRFFHYPHSVSVESGVVLHFPTSISAWRNLMPKYLNQTSWFRALRDSSFQQKNAYRRLLENSSVEVHTVWGARRYMKLSGVCPLSDISDPRWLIRPLRK